MNGGPRRRRRPQPRREQGAQFPYLPLAVVVVLAAGFAIGAFLSHQRSRHDSTSTTSTTASSGVTVSSPEVSAPEVSAQNVSPRLSASSPVPSAALSAPTASPRQHPTLVPATAAPTVAATLVAPPSKPPVVVKPHPAPLPSSRRSIPAPAAASGDRETTPVLSGGPDHVVRAYLTALIRGDERTANTALGRAPDSGTTFPEQDFIDANSHITSVHTSARPDGAFNVETEVTGSKGTYFVTFQVNKTPDGYVIGDHSFIKP